MRAERRAARTTFAPLLASKRAVASPIPLLAPVIATTFPSISLLLMSRTVAVGPIGALANLGEIITSRYSHGVLTEVEAVAVPEGAPRAFRWSCAHLHVGVKDALTIARVVRGRWRWWSHGREWGVEPGALLIQSRGDVCRDVERDERGECQVVVFEGVEERPLSVPLLEALDSRGGPLHRLFDTLWSVCRAPSVDAVVEDALASLRALERAESHTSRAVRVVLRLLGEHLGERLTLEQLSSYAGIDKYHLARRFRAEVGLSPYAYLLRLRISRAKELLRLGWSASLVASEVGFYDQSQMTRHFARVVGVPPALYSRMPGGFA